MKFKVLATDYDGTLADNGFVDAATVDALLRLRQSGWRIVLVTGRLLKSLQEAFPEFSVCDLIIAENGALLYNSETQQERLLADPPAHKFAEMLLERGVEVREVGRVVVATHVPFETLTLETIREMSLELQIIFNKGDIMVLPKSVNKATGLQVALAELGHSLQETVGVGDAENDAVFLKICGQSAAVDNALSPIKQASDIVLKNKASKGVVELIQTLLGGNLEQLSSSTKLPDGCPESGCLIDGGLV